MAREKMLPFKAKVAIAVSGGISSTALSMMIQGIVKRSAALSVDVHLVHVQDREQKTEGAADAVCKLANHLGFPLSTSILDDSLQSTLSAVRDNTDEANLRRAYTIDILTRRAADLGCGVLLLGSSATRVASDIVSAVVCGRGTQVMPAIASHSFHSGCVLVCRPFRDVSARAVTRWAVTRGALIFSGYGGVGARGSSNSGARDVNILSERFILGLQEQNLSTCHTVVKTIAKLHEPSGSGVQCILCDGKVEPFEKKLQALPPRSVSFSNVLLGTNAENLLPSRQCQCADQNGGCGTKNASEISRVREYDCHTSSTAVDGIELCYACEQTIARCGKDSTEKILDAVDRRRLQRRRESMRIQIKEFVLSDDE
eukprot:CAMPEP_0182447084 /NCGR_PEP_ID=MMETSP1172-20130603/11183_1 /TAXON_ID=708627 /ORGANISM="Timspurckia oligopyrenoides, Strain CCMP3278" /LENGTH=370 /DNA_ID=CAMNT_0024643369 /DNA_START=124 /DNA_END=1233 /DNA_ORIENTATION=+